MEGGIWNSLAGTFSAENFVSECRNGAEAIANELQLNIRCRADCKRTFQVFPGENVMECSCEGNENGFSLFFFSPSVPKGL